MAESSTSGRAARGLVSALAIALIGAVLLGCGGGDDEDSKRCPIGDLSAPAEIEIVHLDASQQVVKTEAMAKVPLQPPPQGGWILLLGVRARNIDGCQITLTTVLRDTCSHDLMKLEKRPTKLEVGDDGWGVSTSTTFSNLQVCPTLTATRDLHEEPYIIEVTVEDVDHKKASASLTVVPTCLDDASRCPCECARDYQTGDMCSTVPVDAGVTGACPAAAP
jgi:hypothetical protein